MTIYVGLGMLVAIAAGIRGIWSPCGLSMLTSINPVSERGRKHRYGVTAAWFLLGSVLGGATLGAAMAAGALGIGAIGIDQPVRLGVVGGLALLAALLDVGVLGISMPLFKRQVNERWLDEFRGWFYGIGFGWQIGVGVATYIMTASVFLTAAIGIASGSPVVAFGLGVAFGAVRGSAVFLDARATSPEALRTLLRRLDSLEQPVRRAVIVVEMIAACVATYLAASWLGVGVIAFIAGASALVDASRRMHTSPRAPQPS